jgi:hypothetical protein
LTEDFSGEAAIRAAIDQTETEIVQMEATLERDGVTVTGSRGNVIAHPLLSSLSRHRRTLAELLRAIGELPTTTARQRAARQARDRHARLRNIHVAPEERVFVPDERARRQNPGVYD